MNILSSLIHNLKKKVLSKDSPTARQPIFINIGSNANATILAIIGYRLLQRGENVLFIIDPGRECVADKIKNNFNCKDIDNYIIYLDKISPPISNIGIKYSLIKNQFISEIEDKLNPTDFDSSCFGLIFDQLQAQLIVVDYLIKKYNPKLIIVPEDGLGGNCCLISQARMKNIPVLNIPYGFGSIYDYEDNLYQKEMAKELIDQHSPLSKLVSQLFPHWIKKGKYAGYTFLPPEFILAREALNLGIVNPWTVHGGLSNKLAVESSRMLSHYLRENIQEEKLVLTGSLYCDLLFTALNSDDKYINAYNQKRKISLNKTSILVSWPVSYHKERGQLTEVDSYEKLTFETLKFLSSIENVEITLSLHPALQNSIQDFLSYENIKITHDYLINELPKHDIFICCNSSTLRWATVVAKPVINYNFYKFSTKDYEDLKGVLTVYTLEAFKAVVKQLVDSDEYYHEIAHIQSLHAPEWGMLDGKNFDRIYELICQLSTPFKSNKERFSVRSNHE
ncbi:TPA: hypothetical protein JBA10_16045 [Legionella pneumophila]|uniref:CDP-glycerol glycerophosphotransferase family protein n=1 Tax=Legionella pneumophila TaxID=446 RepID=UPI00048073DE|nr:CDP-glycerol glycerophosphotransferase family protein [Legionella pneumophila]STX73234.1 CDP-Glycerol:Poly(glycerophosphate) glycerophosphotransferase [Legionella pneumophila]HAT2064646.1 hypothetical protein [Legionella pneumophila]HAT2067242.1 hypothetical protein [Legionella pneumophila]HAT2068054.1 hypothetical protein [Legionella pneumophila]HAT2071088.1 hypothetical protein [Legionella pneumophila]